MNNIKKKKKDEKTGLANLKGFDFPIQRPRCERGMVNARGKDDIVNISIELLKLNRCKKREGTHSISG